MVEVSEIELDLIAVGAHPDDVEIACGGTLAALARKGYKVGIVDLTDGEPTPMSPGPDVRLEEARRAAEILGVAVRVNLNLPNRRLFDGFEARVALAKVFRRYRPKVVIGFGGKTVLASPDHYQAMLITDAAVFYSRLTKWDEFFDGLPVHTVVNQLSFPIALKDVKKLAEDGGVKIIDLRFVDLPGIWQHFSFPVKELSDDLFTDGVGFDGSSIRGYQQIQESDMLLIPDPETAYVDPMLEVPTLSMICNVLDPVTLEHYTRDPRYIAQKAESYLRSTGIADISYWGPEAEFYIFDDVRFDQNAQCGYYYIDSEEAIWNSGRKETPNLGYKLRHKEGYFPVPPADTLQDIRSEMILKLEEVGVPVEVHHHEVGTAGQGEIDMRYGTLTKMGDSLMYYKYIIKNVARKHKRSATFMPKPIFGDNGSGMHVHQSLWKGETNLFYDEKGYGGISQTAKYYIGGLLKHAPALLAICAPTTNSYRRLVPGYEAPVNLVFSQRNRSAAVRIPIYSKSPKAKRLEFRCPDPSTNPYLCFAALLMAGLDGIQNKIDPGEPIDKDLYDLEPEEAEKVKSTPGSLAEVLDALEQDHAWLLKGDVFTPDVIETWIHYKRERELAPINLRPVPYEFFLYYDI